MSGVRANWHIREVPNDDRDPFANVAPQLRLGEDVEEVRVEDVGAPIDLHDRSGLTARLTSLLVSEGSLYDDGVRCPVKDQDDTSCLACPIQGEHGKLCDIGCDQERVITALAVLKSRAESS